MPSYDNATRAQALALKLAGHSNAQIESITGIQAATLNALYRKAVSRGLNPAESKRILDIHVQDGARSGRPKKSSEAKLATSAMPLMPAAMPAAMLAAMPPETQETQGAQEAQQAQQTRQAQQAQEAQETQPAQETDEQAQEAPPARDAQPRGGGDAGAGPDPARA
jgi:type IV secretory pathway VirB10-like protein